MEANRTKLPLTVTAEDVRKVVAQERADRRACRDAFASLRRLHRGMIVGAGELMLLAMTHAERCAWAELRDGDDLKGMAALVSGVLRYLGTHPAPGRSADVRATRPTAPFKEEPRA